MSQTLDFTLPADHSGGKLTGFTYTRSLNELIGTWTATAVGGTFTPGAAINIGDVLTNGVITKWQRDSDGLIHIEGKDAGAWLMRSKPENNNLVAGNARAVITDLCSGCLPLAMNTNGLSGFNVRSVLSGATKAEAILELAMLSGCIAYINNAGQLVVAPPSGNTPTFDNIIQENGEDLDLDGYATRVTVVVTRRKESPLDDPNREWHHGGGSSPKYRGVWKGEDLSQLEVTRQTTSDSYTFTDATGEAVTVSYRMTMLVPINVKESSTHSITRAGITITVTETHDINTQVKATLENNQQRVYIGWCDAGYTITTTRTDSTYSINESTTETMTRTFGNWIGKKWTPEVFSNDPNVGELQREVLVKTSTRAGQTPDAGMPDYAPQFDVKTTREYKRLNFGRTGLCVETTVKNEMRQVGKIDTVRMNGVLVTTFDNSILAIPTHSVPQWVEIVWQHIYREIYDDDGNCLVSDEIETSDDGAAWLLRNLNTLDNAQLQQWQQDYAKNLQTPPSVSTRYGSSSINTQTWQFMTIQGRTLVYELVSDGVNEDDTDILNRDAWYENGAYKPTLAECPHLLDGNCTLYGNFSVVGDFEGSACPNENTWRSCIRAQAALEQACYEDPEIGGDAPMLEPPVVATATRSGALVGFQREFYIDDIISESDAIAIAQAAADNILAVKTNKGFTKSATIPYDSSLVPDGSIVSVAHDWANMQTTVTYRDSNHDGTIPEVLIPNSIAGVASFISDRDIGRRTRLASGTVQAINGTTVTVNIGSVPYPCSSKLKVLAVGDAVSVSFSSGNYSRGQIVGKL